MLDMGFWELMIIALVALLVIGPERLPAVASTVGEWVGKGRAFINSVKSDIDSELRLKQLQESMQQSERNNLHEIIEETNEALQEGLDNSNQLVNDLASDSTDKAKKTDG